MVIAYNMEQFVSNHFKHLNFTHFRTTNDDNDEFGSVMGSDGYCSINQRTQHITETIKLFDWLASVYKTKKVLQLDLPIAQWNRTWHDAPFPTLSILAL